MNTFQYFDRVLPVIKSRRKNMTDEQYSKLAADRMNHYSNMALRAIELGDMDIARRDARNAVTVAKMFFPESK